MKSSNTNFRTDGNHPVPNVINNVDVGANLCVCPIEQANLSVCPIEQANLSVCQTSAHSTDAACHVSTAAQNAAEQHNDPKNLRSSVKSASSACLKSKIENREKHAPPATTMAGSFKLLKNKGGYKIKKWLIAAAVAVLMAFNFDANAQTVTYADINIGDYIDGFGGIKWRVINKDANGLLVRTDRALTRAHLAGYRGLHNTTDMAWASGRLIDGAGQTFHTNRNSGGNTNRWHETEIRAWLNGNQWVMFGEQTNPFTNRFNAEEHAAMATVTQIQHLWTIDVTPTSNFGSVYNMPTPTTSTDIFFDNSNSNINGIIMDGPTDSYYTGYQTTINDKIFLLDIKQARNTADVARNPVAAARALRNANGLSYHVVVNEAGENVRSWTRTPHLGSSNANTFNPSYFRVIEPAGTLNGVTGSTASSAVVPAMFLSQSTLFVLDRESDNTLPLNAGREQGGYKVYRLGTQDNIAIIEARNSVTWDNIKGTNTAQDNITSNLTLATTHTNGATISWASNNATAIATNGAVTRPIGDGNNATVTLTATITKGTASETVTFNLTVIAFKEVTAAAIGFAIPTGRAYTGSAQALAITPPTGMGAITVKYDGSTTAPTNAGTYAITADVEASADYVAATGVSLGNYTIARVQLTWGANGTVAAKTYDGNITATIATNPTFSGLVGSETVTLTLGTVAFQSANYNAAGVAITVGGTWGIEGAGAGNYLAPTVPPTFTAGVINQIPLTWATAGTVQTKTYDGGTSATIATQPTLSGVILSENVTVTNGTVEFANANAGTSVAITVSGAWGITGATSGNYIAPADNPAFANGTIERIQLTWSAVPATVNLKTYDGNTNATIATQPTLSGVLAAETANVSVTNGTVAFANSAANTSVTITVGGTWGISGDASGNYSAPLANPTFSNGVIDPAPLTLTANDKVIVIGAPQPAFDFRLDGLIAGETAAIVTTQPAYALTPAFNNTQPGSFIITPSGAVAANYTITYAPGTLTVTNKQIQTLVFTLAAESKTYGDAPFTNALSGDTGDGALTYESANAAVATVDAATGLVTIIGAGSTSILASKAECAEYASATATYNLSVTPKTITLTAHDKTAITGDAMPDFTFTQTGELVGADVWITEPKAESPTANMNLANDYIILITGADAGSNYDIVRVSGTLTVSDPPPFVAVANITGVPTTAVAGTPLTLTGTVLPDAATNNVIVWSVSAAGTTGAVITAGSNVLNTTSAGTVTVIATIENGLTASSDYSQEFTITVSSGGSTTASPELLSATPLRAWSRGGILHITGVDTSEPLSVYSATGSLVYRQVKPQSEEIDVPLKVEGVYVIQSGGRTVRVVFN